MGRRTTRHKRCPRCWVHQRMCICEVVPKLEARTRVSVIIHHRESLQTTNTGHLVALCLPGSEYRIFGNRAAPLDEEGIVPEGHQAYSLFPSDDALPLTREEVEADGRPVTLVVPDSTWKQASRMAKRCAPLAKLPRRLIPPGPPSGYKLRRVTRPGGLSTFEAIARALGVLEGEELQRRMEQEVFQVMIDRVLWARNVLRADQVTGGLPPDLLRMGRPDADLMDDGDEDDDEREAEERGPDTHDDKDDEGRP